MNLFGTTSVTVRLPNPIVEYIDESEWEYRSEFLRYWANVGWRVCRDPELREALEWALDREVQDPDHPVNNSGGGGGGPLEVVKVYATHDVIFGHDTEKGLYVAEERHWKADTDEVEQIHDDQLEALRNRVR